MSSTPLLEGRVCGGTSEILEIDLELGYSSDVRSERRLADVKTKSPEACLVGAKNMKSANGISEASSEGRLADSKMTSPEASLAGAKNTESEIPCPNVNSPKSEASKKESRTTAKNTVPDSSPEPRLPVCTANSKQEAKTAAKHQVLYAVGLMAPVPLLAAAAALKLFLGWWGLVAGVAVGVWILASSGMVVNQYGRSHLEQRCAKHLSHLGILSTALLLSFFVFRAFFPDSVWALVFLIFITLLVLGAPWVWGCLRADG